MAEPQLVVFIVVMIVSLFISLVFGIMFLMAKELSFKKKKIFGVFLLAVGLANFILFNLLVFSFFSTYKMGEFISLILLFVIPFVEGFTLLTVKEVKPKLLKILGWLLIFLPVFWVVMMIAFT